MDIDEFLEGETKNIEKVMKAPTTKVEGIENKSIAELIDKVKELMEKKDFKEAANVYMMAKERFSNLTKHQIEEKNIVHDQIADVNEKLIDKLTILKAEADKKAKIIDELLEKAEMHLNAGNLLLAEQLYKQVASLFNEVPDIFAELKLRIDNKVSSFKVKLTDKQAKIMQESFAKKKDELNKLLETAFNHVLNNRMDIAKEHYARINRLYKSLPEGYALEKILIYKSILKLYKETELKLEIKGMEQELKEAETAPLQKESPLKTERMAEPPKPAVKKMMDAPPLPKKKK